jgi:hypothetical protein
MTHECHAKEKRTTKRVTQWLGALVTNSCLQCSQSAGGCEVKPCLHQNEELIFRGEILPLDARFRQRSPASVLEEMN